MALESSIITPRVYHGLSDCSQSKLFLGSSAHRCTFSIMDSEYAALSFNGSLS